MAENETLDSAAEKPALPSVIFSRAEVVLLWSLINANGVVVTPKEAATCAELYATLKKLAQLHAVPVGD